MTRLPSFATLSLMAATLVCPLSAQAAACKGNAFIDSIYQNGMGGNRYEYFAQVRNQTNKPIRMDLVFASMPKTVTLFSPSLPGITLQPYASQTIRFGNGTNGNISTGTVTVAYDNAPAGRPSATLRNCQ